HGPLDPTLALLAMTMATAATKVVPLDMTQDSFDDQHRGCGPAMKARLPVLNCSEFQKNLFFAWAWPEAVAEWQRLGSPVSPLSSSVQAITLMAFMTYICLWSIFNIAMRVAGHSRLEYQENFHFKTLHFLLTNALATLRDTQKGQCLDNVFRGVRDHQFKVKKGDEVRFGQFASTSLSKTVALGFGNSTMFKVYTCHGVDIQKFSMHPEEKEVLIPPFETFMVTDVHEKDNMMNIELKSTRKFSKYDCEWLKGDIMG
ncbi:NRT2 ribosyltransferase, partial [Sylvia borin]|nr:NRT2 ribosyltransferase [Sylvia borin]